MGALCRTQRPRSLAMILDYRTCDFPGAGFVNLSFTSSLDLVKPPVALCSSLRKCIV